MCLNQTCSVVDAYVLVLLFDLLLCLDRELNKYVSQPAFQGSERWPQIVLKPRAGWFAILLRIMSA